MEKCQYGSTAGEFPEGRMHTTLPFEVGQHPATLPSSVERVPNSRLQLEIL